MCAGSLPGSTQNQVHPVTPSICFYHCAFFAQVSPSSIAIMNQEIYAQHPLSSHEGHLTRVLQLEPGEWDDVIRCSLKLVNLSGSSKPEFEAISYVWGERLEVPPQILVDGRTFNVGVNLQAALRHFRSKTKMRMLWADAICINQNDIDERNQQVALMRHIYQQCERVLVWLGENGAATPEIRWKTDFTRGPQHPLINENEGQIQEFVARFKKYYELPFALRYHLKIDSVMGAYCLLSRLAQNICLNQENFPFLSEEASHNIFLALGDIVSRPWWTRIWVVQELVLPRQAMVYYGNFVAPWDLYVHAARNYNAHRGSCCKDHYRWLQSYDIRLLEAFMHAVLEVEDLRHEWQQSLVLRDNTGGRDIRIYLRRLLWKFRNRISCDPRDQIYALLSLVTSWGGGRSMYVDYSVEMKTLYQVTTERIVNAEKSLLVLAGITTKGEGRHVLPTWVPDWTSRPSSRFESERLERLDLFNASNGEKLDIPVRVTGGSFLKLCGNFVDEVTNVSKVMAYDDRNLDKSLDTFASWYEFVTLQGLMTTKYVTSRETRMEAYWRTLCMDTVRKNIRNSMDACGKGYEYQRCPQDYVQKSLEFGWIDKELRPQLSFPKETHPQDAKYSQHDHREGKGTEVIPPSRIDRQEEPSTDAGSLNYIEVDFAICSATMHRRLFMTRQGFLGLGPSEINNGDRVYIFAGSHVPFIVRQAQDRIISGGKPEKCFELIGDCYVHGIMDGELMPQRLGQQEAMWFV